MSQKTSGNQTGGGHRRSWVSVSASRCVLLAAGILLLMLLPRSRGYRRSSDRLRDTAGDAETRVDPLAVVSKAVPGQDWERQKVTHTSAESGETAGEGEMQLSSSSIWPVVLGAGIALLLFGLATHLGFSVVGLLLIAGSLWGWIGELRYS